MDTISNRQLKLLRKLGRKKYRDQEALFLLEGGRAVMQLIVNGTVAVEGLFFDESQRWWEGNEWQDPAKKFPSASIDAKDFAKVSDTDNPQGVLALCRMPQEQSLEKLARASGIIVATDAIQDPGNLGTIVRTASWFGVTGLLCGKGTVDLFHPKVVRSTAGATGTIPFRNSVLGKDLDILEHAGWETVLLDGGEGSVDIRSLPSSEKRILVVGNEAHGLSPELLSARRTKAMIQSPAGKAQVESLNASIALSIALYAFSK